jgi:hypothetical protein
MNTPEFERVLICNIHKRDTRIPVRTEEEYINEFKRKNKQAGGLCEIVGLKEYQVKPYFDVDGKDKSNESFDVSIINNICDDIQTIYNNDIYIAKREPREEGGVMKYSYRLYLKARITWTNIPILFKEVFDKYSCVDKSVYDRNRILFVPLSDRKKDLDVPPLINIKGSIFDCCATYIKEQYNDLDSEMPEIEVPKFEMKSVLSDDNEPVYEGTLNFAEIMQKLSKERATTYNDWFYIGVSLINL